MHVDAIVCLIVISPTLLFFYILILGDCIFELLKLPHELLYHLVIYVTFYLLFEPSILFTEIVEYIFELIDLFFLKLLF